MFRSLYRFGAFNGDPHPGNYLFRSGGQVTFVDFGLVKSLTSTDVALDVALPFETREGVGHRARPSPGASRVRASGVHRPRCSRRRRTSRAVHGIFWDAVRRDDTTTITAQWASEVARIYLAGRENFADVMAHAGMPPAYAVLQRINLGLLAILGRLEATANWRRIAEELWPTSDPASTELGRRESEWWDETHAGFI